MAPLYASKRLSKINARVGSSDLSGGGGTLLTIASKISGIPIPDLAEHKTASEASKPMISSISCLTRSGSAEGKSILLITGMISRSCSKARYTFANVCASTPCAASTTSKAPSQAARERETS